MVFNPEAELRALAEADARRGGRKMSFARQCAAFAALYEGVAPKVVGLCLRFPANSQLHFWLFGKRPRALQARDGRGR